MWGKRMRFLLTISCVLTCSLFLAPGVAGQGYGGLDDSQQFGGGNQQNFGGGGGFPQNQQVSSLPQYESAEQQAPRQNPGFPPQQQQQQPYSPQGAGAPPYGGPPQQPQNDPQQNMWWQGQNAFQRPPGHPGVEQLAPSGQAPPQQTTYSPNYNPYGNGGAPFQQTTTFRPPPPAPTQPSFNAPPPPPPPVPQEPDVQQFPNPGPVPQQTPFPDPYGSPPTPPPQQPPQAGFGWNPPSQEPSPQNNYPQAPPPPPQNYQPPPQFQPQQQQPYQPQPQQPYQPPVAPPNQGYRPPPQQPTNAPPAPRPNNPYQSNQLSSPNFQQPQQKPYTPRPRPQQQPKQPQDPGLPYPGCPAAMKCVQDDYCNAIGLIEDAPIQFSAADRLHRVALMQCSEPMTGIVGVCCRDPNYTDPWPDMKKDGGQHNHHPDKGHSQGQPSFQPPQGNHLQSGNPYSGPGGGSNRNTNSNNGQGWNRNRNNVQCADKNNNIGSAGIRANNVGRNDDQVTKPSTAGSNNFERLPKNLRHVSPFNVPLSSPNLTSESKQTIQVLEPCSQDELCLSMSQCHSLNPQFMAKTGLNPADAKQNIAADSSKQLHNDSEPVKVKRCKYERSGIHYLCCKKPSDPLTSTSTTPAPPTTFHFTPDRFKPTIFTIPSFNPPTTTPSSLISGFGLRFHSGLHTQKQKEVNSRKPNPYKENEEPIQLISPVIAEKTTFPTTPFTSQPFRFITSTTPAPALATKSHEFRQSSQSFSSRFSSTPSTTTLARVISTHRTYFSTTTPPTTNSVTTNPTTPIDISRTTSQQTSVSNDSITTPEPSTTTEGKVDISKIPIPVPLQPELKAEPPIGYIFKGDDLYIPEIEIPSQNYLVPINDFEERTFPTEAEDDDAATEVGGLTTSGDVGGEVQDNEEESTKRNITKKSVFNSRNPFLHNNSIEGTTIYSILDESSGNSGSHETIAG